MSWTNVATYYNKRVYSRRQRKTICPIHNIIFCMDMLCKIRSVRSNFWNTWKYNNIFRTTTQWVSDRNRIPENVGFRDTRARVDGKIQIKDNNIIRTPVVPHCRRIIILFVSKSPADHDDDDGVTSILIRDKTYNTCLRNEKRLTGGRGWDTRVW